jgi:flagellar motor switch protein FliN/FliY
MVHRPLDQTLSVLQPLVEKARTMGLRLFGTAFDRPLTLEDPSVTRTTLAETAARLQGPYLLAELYLMSRERSDPQPLLTLTPGPTLGETLGIDLSPESVDSLTHLGRLTEPLETLVDVLNAHLATLTRDRLYLAQPSLRLIDLPADLPGLLLAPEEALYALQYRLTSPSGETTVLHLLTVALVDLLVASLRGPAVESAGGGPPSLESVLGPEPAGAGGEPVVKPARFAPLEERPGPAETAPSAIDLILDVPLTVTVELGRTTKTIGEILALGPGSIIELDKLHGEPVDILVNDRLIAKGEVVVVDDNFGVRIVDIIPPTKRAQSLR